MGDAWVLLFTPFVLVCLWVAFVRPPPPQPEDLQARDTRYLG